MDLDKMTRTDLEAFILNNGSLYNKFDETKLLSGTYSQKELVDITAGWIFEGDETEKV